MGAYRVGHNYRTRDLLYEEGSVVEVDDELAAWVNRDSEGTLVPVEDKPAAKPKAGIKKAEGDDGA